MKHLNVQEVADRLAVHPQTVRQAIKRGALVAYKFEGAYRIEPDDLDAYRDASRVIPTPSPQPNNVSRLRAIEEEAA